MRSENNTIMKYVKDILIIIGCLAILTIVGLGTKYNWKYISEGVLGITAAIILWYTWETSKIRKANEIIADANKEASERDKKPSVGYSVFTNPNCYHDTRFRLVNQSFYPVAVKVRCNFKIDGKPLEGFSNDSDGTNYWNLQTKQEKEGHFSWLDLHEKAGLISPSEVRKMKTANVLAEKLINDYFSTTLNFKLPQLTMDIELYCKNQIGFFTYYPPASYKYDYDRKVWIPTLTSDKPYWEFESKPSWA